MVVFIVGSPKLPAPSCKALAFLSESINRVVITGVYLTRDSDLMASEVRGYLDVHDVSTVVRRTTQ